MCEMEDSKGEVYPEGPTGERWDPLGAPNDQENESSLERLDYDYHDE